MIIQEIGVKIIENLGKKVSNMIIDACTLSEMVLEIQKSMNKLGVSILEGIISDYNKAIKDSSGRKKSWNVVRQDERKIMTPMGEVRIRRDYYRNKNTGEHAYLLDEALGLAKHDRLDRTMKTELLRQAESVSYEKASKHNNFAPVSRQTVLHCIRETGVVKVEPEELEKRKTRYLYIEADEDHITYQGEGRGNAKLIYVHEGAERGGKRTRLIETFHFASAISSAEELWMEVADYIYERYDMDEIEKIYISGDGAGWIRVGMGIVPKSIFILDRFHRNEYIKKAAGANEGYRRELKSVLDAADEVGTFTMLKRIYEASGSEAERRRILDARQYFRKNWDGIEAATRYPNVIGCSAEGHVSHILSERLSSRPKAWSRNGAEQMARLRAFVRNGGDLRKEIQKKTETRRNYLSRKVMKEITKKIKIGIEKHDNIFVLNSGKKTPIFMALKMLQQTRWQVI